MGMLTMPGGALLSAPVIATVGKDVTKADYAAINLMEADPKKLIHRNAFNVTAMSIDPEKLVDSIRAQIPEFVIDYNIDPVRQAIADSWPNSLDDSAARKEWGWQPKYDLETMTKDMLTHLKEKLAK